MSVARSAFPVSRVLLSHNVWESGIWSREMGAGNCQKRLSTRRFTFQRDTDPELVVSIYL